MLCRSTLRNPWVAALLRGYVKPPSQMPKAVNVEHPPHTHTHISRGFLSHLGPKILHTSDHQAHHIYLLQGLVGVFC